MLMLLALAVPLAVLDFTMGGDDDDEEEAVERIGSDADEDISGGLGNDFIDADAGDDVINGRAGDDLIFGREGADVLQGEDGNDMLCSGDDNDIVTGNRGNDFIEGQEGDDFVSGDYGFDSVRGDEGNDTVIGGRGGDILEGGTGDDILFGGIIQGLPLNLTELTALRDGGSLDEINNGIEMRDDSLGDSMRGEDGDDQLIIGAMDEAVGNNGADIFHILSEQSIEGGATIVDYNADDDAITVIVDDTSVDADITVINEGGDAIVRMGDTVLARVQGAAGTLSTADITLIAHDTVAALLDPNAAAAVS